MILKVVKKPIAVSAVEVRRDNREDIITVLSSSSTKWEEKADGFLIHTWEGMEPVKYDNDYVIIKGIKGECYPCEGKVFRESYEVLNEQKKKLI